MCTFEHLTRWFCRRSFATLLPAVWTRSSCWIWPLKRLFLLRTTSKLVLVLWGWKNVPSHSFLWCENLGKRTYYDDEIKMRLKKKKHVFLRFDIKLFTTVCVHPDRCFKVRLLSHRSLTRARAVIRDVSKPDLLIKSKPTVTRRKRPGSENRTNAVFTPSTWAR